MTQRRLVDERDRHPSVRTGPKQVDDLPFAVARREGREPKSAAFGPREQARGDLVVHGQPRQPGNLHLPRRDVALLPHRVAMKPAPPRVHTRVVNHVERLGANARVAPRCVGSQQPRGPGDQRASPPNGFKMEPIVRLATSRVRSLPLANSSARTGIGCARTTSATSPSPHRPIFPPNDTRKPTRHTPNRYGRRWSTEVPAAV